MGCHIPILARERDGDLRLYGHVASGNPHAESFVRKLRPRSSLGVRTLTFQRRGTKSRTRRSRHGTTLRCKFPGGLQTYDTWSAVRMLSKMEGEAADALIPERLDAKIRESSLRAIVAFELRAERVYAKAKLSQNRTAADRARVFERLSNSEDQTERECAEAMASLRL